MMLLLAAVFAITLGLAGCEAAAPESACGGDLAKYGTTLEDDRDHCGACGHACSNDEMCVDSECVGDRGWAQWPMPELPRTDDQFEIGNRIVRDRITGLDWQRDVPAQRIAFDEAGAHCADLELEGGGWRLPTRIELVSIVDYSRAYPAINTNAFPDTPNAPFKHARLGDPNRPGDDAPHDTIDFSEGTLSAAFIDGVAVSSIEQAVRCVRAAPQRPASTKQRYDVSAETALDRMTGLRWARTASASCASDRCAVSTELDPHVANTDYCEALELDGYDDFRVPTLPELLSILYPRAHGWTHLRVDPDAFPTDAADAVDDTFDTSTPHATHTDNHWTLNMRSGDAYLGAARRVRCVRTEPLTSSTSPPPSAAPRRSD